MTEELSLEQALDLVVEKLNAPIYRDLVVRKPKYIRVVMRMAHQILANDYTPIPKNPGEISITHFVRKPKTPLVPLEVVQGAIAKRKTCKHWTRCSTGCGADDCALKGKVTLHDCTACMTLNSGFESRDRLSHPNLLQLPSPAPSEKRPMAIVNPPQTMTDLAGNAAAYLQQVAADQAQLAADQTASTAASTALTNALAAFSKLGKEYVIDNGDGTGTVYRPNGDGTFSPTPVVIGAVPIPAST